VVKIEPRVVPVSVPVHHPGNCSPPVPETVPRHPAATMYPPVPASVVPPVLPPPAATLPASAGNHLMASVPPAGGVVLLTSPTLLDFYCSGWWSYSPVPATAFSPVPSVAAPTPPVLATAFSPPKAPPAAMLNSSAHPSFHEATATVSTLPDADEVDPLRDFDEDNLPVQLRPQQDPKKLTPNEIKNLQQVVVNNMVFYVSQRQEYYYCHTCMQKHTNVKI